MSTAISVNSRQASKAAVYASIPALEANANRKEISNMKYVRKQCWLIVIGALLFVVFWMCIVAVRKAPEFSQYNLVRRYPNAPAVQGPRSILLWNSFFGDKRWSLPDDTIGPDYFRRANCPVYQCELTNNPDFLPSVDMFDAVIFHTAEPFPLLNSVPALRSAQQFYIFALMEPPGETKHILSDEGDFYNLTMTYRLDSDILWPYRSVVDVQSGAVVSPAKYPVWREAPSSWNDSVIGDLWSGKTKMAAWFVSHCETLSRREELAAALRKYIDVDIYGKCGTLSCPRSSKACDDMLDLQYKFYFSFENSLCTDYVSEKLYNALERNIIPVVYGGANYTRLLPPHSYINAESFSSAEELANYLKYVATHREEYLRYFWWRHYYRIGYLSPFCDLCEKLHSPTFQQKSQSYRNIEKWWLGGSCRMEARISF